MRRKIVRLLMLGALALPTMLAVGAQTQETQKAEIQRMTAALHGLLNRSTEGLTVVKQEDGAEIVDFTGRFRTALVARKNADGTRSQVCVGSAQEAAAFFANTQMDAPSPSHKANK